MRKIKEIFIAQELRRFMPRIDNGILPNNIYYANGYYGYWLLPTVTGKGVNQLSLSQVAFLCSIPNNPNRYDPLTNMEHTLERRDEFCSI